MMPGNDRRSLDYYGAALLILLGAAVLWFATGLEIGSLHRMGAGFMPAVYGTLLAIIGVMLGVATSFAKPVMGDDGHATGPFELRGWGCIVGGVVAFVVFGQYGGLVPASFAAIFVASLGDRNNSVAGAALLGAGITVAGVVVFHYGLKLQLPLFAWG